jgi:hypothetical protein
MVVLLLSRQALAQSKESAMAQHTSYRTVKVDGLWIFYREAEPTLLLRGKGGHRRFRVEIYDGPLSPGIQHVPDPSFSPG